ncbi:c-type cytochrome [Rariglobus hedericola]|uniref:Cytochrome c n=1 Tax=Rariglobus hedericola TaxID=2597822 RepID=A0A556QEQ7_9BACT|nr:cytochrome c [Rariglobus hedericola]TSJ75134.1 cytochrome c [Rariglobus hedericola]
MSADKNKNFSADQNGASDESIQKVHSKLVSEKPEPKEGYKAMPLFLLGLVSAMIFVTSIYVVQHRGGFSPMVYDERFDPKTAAAGAGKKELTPEQIIAAGKKAYLSGGACVTCHQTNGQGVAGTYPPLAGSEWVQGNEERVIRIVLHGLNGPLTVHGHTYNSAMPAFGKVVGGGFNWNEEKVAQVLTYVRQEWGNTSAPITKEKVAEVLAAEKARAKPWTQGELETFK